MKYIGYAMCLVLAFSLLVSPTPAFALESTVSNMGNEYKNSPFYDRLLEVELTGDNRYDAVAVAISQLGYHEGDNESEMDGLNSEGGKNFAEYTRVWGKVDNQEGNGVSYGYAWCAAFVSWCLRQARVPTDIAHTEISCGRMTTWYKIRERFYSADSGYTPILGDIIMFADEDSPSHVGFVLGVKDGRVYTIEGNGGERVATHSYSLTSSYVYGYCVPKYGVKKDSDYSALMEKALSPVGDYIVTSKTLNVMAAADNTSEILGSMSKDDRVKVIGADGKWYKIEYQDGEAWVTSSALTNEKYMVYTVKYNLKGGRGVVTAQRKILGDTVILDAKKPTKTGYTFMGWSTDKSGNTVDYEHGAEYTADADVTLFAVWKPYQLTVTYYNDDGSVYEEMLVDYNDWLAEPETPPTKPDDDQYSYTFSGWNRELETIVVRNLEYTATFTAIPLPPKPETGIKPWVMITIISAAVVIIAAAATTFVVVKKKKSGKA